MSSLTYVRNETAVPTGTLAGLFTRAVDDLGDAPALRRFLTPDTLQDISYAEAEGIVSHVVAALDGIGLSRGDRAAILSENRPEWALADYGCLCAGIVDVPIYSTLTAPQVAYILKDSGSGLVFVSTGEQMAKVVEAREECAHPVQIVVFDPPEELPEGVMDWAAFMEKGAEVLEGWEEGEFRRRAAVAAPDDLATVLYTSGTTGTPKGVMLSHNNIFSNVEASDIVLYLGEDDETLNFLPLSHILQRMVDYLFFSRGCTITYARSMLTVVDDMQVVRPTVVVSVPRLYEKIYNGVMEARGVKARIVAWAVGVADRAAAFRLAGGREGGLLRMQYRLADKLVFSKVRAAMGGRIRYFVSGGAPLAPDLNRFFYSIGITILEGYGLTETSPVTNVNTQVDFRIGTVGKAVPGTEIRIADDGEILIRGPQVMLGYYFKPEATAEAIDEEKWFHTGDIGELDEDGFLRITDRKKDIIVTAAGKNVAPQPIENRLKANPFIEQAVMVGDRRRFVSLLVVPSFVNLEAWAAAR
ncbi:MAG: long-chain fatty acid--CoA ligase, partial [Gemmatimonadota bacterium]|nr:long-chain fatty acid--CoA ligase [Gemmatimonadota bacterium]